MRHQGIGIDAPASDQEISIFEIVGLHIYMLYAMVQLYSLHDCQNTCFPLITISVGPISMK